MVRTLIDSRHAASPSIQQCASRIFSISWDSLGVCWQCFHLSSLPLTHSLASSEKKNILRRKKNESPNKRRNRRLSSIFFKIFFSVAYASAFSTRMKYLPVPREKVRKRKEWQAAGKAKKHKRAYKRHVSGNISHHC